MSSDLCGKLEIDVEIKASAEQFHHMFKNKPHHIHTTTDKVQGVELHEGEWGTVGSVVTWKYFHDGQLRVGKDIIEDIDGEKNSITAKVIEGDLLEHFKNIKLILQATPKADGSTGSVVRWTVQYEKHHGEIVDPHTFVDYLRAISEDLDVHLLQES